MPNVSKKHVSSQSRASLVVIVRDWIKESQKGGLKKYWNIRISKALYLIDFFHFQIIKKLKRENIKLPSPTNTIFLLSGRPDVWNLFNLDLESEMDDAFARLEDISVEQTLQRLESLFDSSDHFPQVTLLPIRYWNLNCVEEQ